MWTSRSILGPRLLDKNPYSATSATFLLLLAFKNIASVSLAIGDPTS